MQSYYYLLIDFFTIIIPLLFSFESRIRFQEKLKSYLPAIFFSGLIFLIWDHYFTLNHIWGFNPKYLTGISFYALPLEEILFFFCIPYACLFSYEVVKYFLEKRTFSSFAYKSSQIISIVLILFALTMSLIFHDKAYTLSTFSSLTVLLSINLILKSKFLANFFLSYTILLIPFFIVNGLLTGTGLSEPIVWYNDSENIGIRVLSIPVEDIFYGMLLILLSLSFSDEVN